MRNLTGDKVFILHTFVHAPSFLDRLISKMGGPCNWMGLFKSITAFRAMLGYFLLILIRFTGRLKGKKSQHKDLKDSVFHNKHQCPYKDASFVNI